MVVSLIDGTRHHLYIDTSETIWKIIQSIDKLKYCLVHSDERTWTPLIPSEYNYILSVLEDKFNKPISELTLNQFNYI